MTAWPGAHRSRRKPAATRPARARQRGGANWKRTRLFGQCCAAWLDTPVGPSPEARRAPTRHRACARRRAASDRARPCVCVHCPQCPGRCPAGCRGLQVKKCQEWHARLDATAAHLSAVCMSRRPSRPSPRLTVSACALCSFRAPCQSRCRCRCRCCCRCQCRCQCRWHRRPSTLTPSTSACVSRHDLQLQIKPAPPRRRRRPPPPPPPPGTSQLQLAPATGQGQRGQVKTRQDKTDTPSPSPLFVHTERHPSHESRNTKVRPPQHESSPLEPNAKHARHGSQRPGRRPHACHGRPQL